MKRVFLISLGCFSAAHGAEPILRPPGFRPKPPEVQVITASAIVLDPTNRLSPGTIIIRNGVIEAVGSALDIPAGARIWNFTNRTIYAGFIDPAVSLKSTNTTRGLIASATHFYGVDNKDNDTIGLESTRVTPQRRAVEGYAPETKDLEAMRDLGFTAGNIIGERGIFRGTTGVVLFNEENPHAAVLRKQGLEVALTTRGLNDKKNFRKNLRLAVDRGLSEDDALAALTVIPARICGLEAKLGTIAAGKIANLTVVENEGIFAATNKVTDVWVAGQVFHLAAPEEKKAAERKEDPKLAAVDKEKKEADDKKAAEKRELMIKRLAKSAQDGRGPLASPANVLVKNATVWTSGPDGILEGTDVLFAGGKVSAIGKSLTAPADTQVIDGSGKFLSPGLIDAHSHAAVVGSVNEGSLPSTAMVRIADVVNSETRNLEEELAGGLTMANLLHGSANPIGGQNCVIKFRDGAAPEDLKFQGAPEGIKFALGENVKQANWGGDTARTRFPQSRMGVPVFMRNRFLAARAYAEALRATPSDTRRDLELDAIVEIIEGKRLVHCHSYRQDEILAFLRTMEEFGVRVATLQHVLEGYKVADEMAKHGVGGSTFSDWYNYKFEVIDAIPHNGSIMRERGVVVSFNSDSSDLARRLYTEAAKAVKYGGTSEIEAFKFVTLNPAKQLHIDQRVGSIEVGKDADFVIWSKAPLDSATVCLETWIDGKKYFDRSAVPAKMAALQKERADLLAKAKKAVGLGGGEKGDGPEAKFFELPLELMHEGVRHCDDE